MIVIIKDEIIQIKSTNKYTDMLSQLCILSYWRSLCQLDRVTEKSTAEEEETHRQV
jgi:hypothetical protein